MAAPWILLAITLCAAAAAWWVERRKRIEASRGSDDLMLEMLGAMPRGVELSELLNGLADSVRSATSADRSMLRLYNPRTRMFEMRAYSGIDPDTLRSLSNRDVSEERFRELCDGSGGVIVLPPNDGFPDTAICSPRSAGVLIVTLGSCKQGGVVGYLLLEIPPGECIHWAQRRGTVLRLMATAATQAIDAARARGQLEQRSVDLNLATDKLKDLQRLKDNFVGAVSHELRTPLTSVKAYAEMLHRSGSSIEPRTLQEFTQVILKESERLNEALDDILNVAQLESGKARLLPQLVDLAEICRSSYEEHRDALREAEISLSLQLPEQGVELHADRAALLQLLGHLLDNARKFTPSGGYVRIRVREDVSVVRLEVEDSGIGVPEGEIDRIFDRFHQVDNSSTRNYGGQGLGLAICRDLVRWHGGQIWAEPVPTGGARFVVLLPSKGLVVQPHAVGSLQSGERLERDQFLHLLIAFVAESLDVQIASLMLVDEGSQRLYLEAAVGLEDEIVRSVRLAKGEGIAGHVWESGRSLLIDDLTADDRFVGRMNNIQYTTRSLLSCPILRDGHCIGVVNVNNRSRSRPFDRNDQLLLEALVERVERALDAFGDYAKGHLRLAAANAALSATLEVGRSRSSTIRELLIGCGLDTARAMDLGDAEMRDLAFALRSYDLGLSRVDERILHKASPLDPQERRRLEEHVRVGAELAEGLEAPPSVLKILAHHHENFDGSGYPDGLRGEAIPIGARIVRLVDHSNGLLHARPERPGYDFAELEEELRGNMGTLFCSRVTPIFLNELMRRRDDILRAIERTRGIEPVAAGIPEETR